jgi:hypothetical protein
MRIHICNISSKELLLRLHKATSVGLLMFLKQFRGDENARTDRYNRLKILPKRPISYLEQPHQSRASQTAEITSMYIHLVPRVYTSIPQHDGAKKKR